MGGTSNVGKADLKPLEGRDVIVWPDADQPGKDAATALVARLRGIASDVRLVRVDDLPLKADAADVTWTADDLLARLESPAAPKKIDRGESALALLARDMPPIQYLCEPWIAEGLTIVASRPKLGKTTLLRQCAAEIAQGGELFGERCQLSEVLFLELEEGDRLNREKLERASFPVEALRRIYFKYEWPRGEDGARQLDEYLTAYPETRLVVIDSLTRFRSVPDRNVPPFMADYEAISQLHRVAKKHPGRVIVVIHHTKKAKSDDPIDDISGTYGLTAACDSYWVLRPHKEGVELHVGGRLWSRDESSYGLIRGQQRFTLTDAFDGLQGSQIDTLRIVRESGTVTPSNLAKLLNIGRQSAMDRLNALVVGGHLRRVRGKHGEYECT